MTNWQKLRAEVREIELRYCDKWARTGYEEKAGRALSHIANCELDACLQRNGRPGLLWRPIRNAI